MGLDTTHSSSKYDHTHKLYQLFICVDMIILPFYTKYYGFYPFTIKHVCPIASLLFWICYWRAKYKSSMQG